MKSDPKVSIEVVSNEAQLLKWKQQWINAFHSGSSLDLSASYHSLGSDFLHLTTDDDQRHLYIIHTDKKILALISIRANKSIILKHIPIKRLTTGGHFVSDMLLSEEASDTHISALFTRIMKDFPEVYWIDMNRITGFQYKRLLTWAKQCHFSICKSDAEAHYCFNVSNESFDEFTQKLGKKTRSNMKYYQRLIIREQGDLTFEFITPKSHTENDRLFNEFLIIEHSGWKGDQNSSIVKRPASLAYHQSMCVSAFENGQMLWARCTVNGKIIAMMYLITRGDKLWAVKTAYDESFHRYSPGALLTFKLVEYGFENPQIKVISMISHYDWVKRWQPISESYHALRIFPKSFKSSFLRNLLLRQNPSWTLVNVE